MPIRTATVVDIPAMLALERAAPSVAHWSQSQYEVAVASLDRVSLVSEVDSVVEAFLVARALGGEWEIENIVISVRQRRQGLGSCLLAEACDCARLRNANAIFLEVRESNLAARALYEKNGFVQIGGRAHYYHDPEENALVYRLEVARSI